MTTHNQKGNHQRKEKETLHCCKKKEVTTQQATNYDWEWKQQVQQLFRLGLAHQILLEALLCIETLCTAALSQKATTRNTKLKGGDSSQLKNSGLCVQDGETLKKNYWPTLKQTNFWLQHFFAVLWTSPRGV